MAGRITYYGGVVRDGLVLYLDAGKPDSYPKTGDLWSDLTGNQNNGALSGSIFNSDNGGSIVFDGTDDFVNCGTNSTTMLTTSGSLSVWAKINTYNHANFWSLAGRGGSAGFDTNGYTIWYYTSINSMVATITNKTPINYGNVTVSFGTSVSLGNIIHNYTMTWDDTRLTTYLDGVFKNTTLYSYGAGDTTSTPFIIGRGPTNFYSSSNVYNVSLYNKTLSSSEVLKNYNALKGRYNL